MVCTRTRDPTRSTYFPSDHQVRRREPTSQRPVCRPIVRRTGSRWSKIYPGVVLVGPAKVKVKERGPPCPCKEMEDSFSPRRSRCLLTSGVGKCYDAPIQTQTGSPSFFLAGSERVPGAVVGVHFSSRSDSVLPRYSGFCRLVLGRAPESWLEKVRFCFGSGWCASQF